MQARAAGADWFTHLIWATLGVRSAWREDSEFSPARGILWFCRPSRCCLSFLSGFQGVLLPTHLFLLPFIAAVSFFMLVRHGSIQPPLSPLYDGLFLV
jgi:hypothetical protein